MAIAIAFIASSVRQFRHSSAHLRAQLYAVRLDVGELGFSQTWFVPFLHCLEFPRTLTVPQPSWMWRPFEPVSLDLPWVFTLNFYLCFALPSWMWRPLKPVCSMSA